jgi:hypothetical protein
MTLSRGAARMTGMRISATAERHIDAPADRIYGYIRDYRVHHPRFLPREFGPLTIENGGVGAGTVLKFSMTVGGRTTSYRVTVEEPEPGRVLTESDPSLGMVTSFTVEPAGDGSRVRIDTSWNASGLGGLMQRLFAPGVLRGLYAKELVCLEKYAADELGPGRVLTVVAGG